VPNFFIEKFRIPPFLLPIYQAAGVEYGVRWEILAAINEIETDYGRNLNVSSPARSAGCSSSVELGPLRRGREPDGLADPYNPVDAIFSAARYLRAAGADQDLRRAIYAYNHADWYVDSVLLRARLIGGLPPIS
jgi:membrane-bound lytic murein transglycosylase B